MDTLRAIEGIEIFPVISLLLFVTVFTVMLVRAIRLDRRELDRCARLPFSDDSAETPVPRGPLTARE